MATEFFREDITSLTKELGTPQVANGYAYLSAYVYAKAAMTGSTIKTGKADLLREGIRVEFLSNALAVAIFDVQPSVSSARSLPLRWVSKLTSLCKRRLQKLSRSEEIPSHLEPYGKESRDQTRVSRTTEDPRVAAGLQVFDLLDEAVNQADSVTLALQIGHIIFGEPTTILRGILLLGRAVGWPKLMGAYTKVFLVEEEDLPWVSVFADVEPRSLLQDWLSRFA
jgi:hypothetical protein